MLRRLYLPVCILIFVLIPAVSRSQAIRIDLRRSSLEAALLQFRSQSGIDIVFTQALVAGRKTTCTYRGNDPQLALNCLLRNTGLRAEPVRRRQYVVVRIPEPGAEEPIRPVVLPRGSIMGFVVDGETGEVLPNAHVFLPDLRIGTSANDAGYFAMGGMPPGDYRVRLSYIGFQSVDTTLAVGGPAETIRLQPLIVQADSVVIEGSRDDRPDIASIPGVVDLPVGRLAQLPTMTGEPDLFQALRWMPGVQQSGELFGGLSIRGGEPDQNLFLIDGAPVYHPWHAFSLISTFQTETLKNVRLYRGSFPAEHGGRLAAVLDAQLRDGNTRDPHITAGVSVLAGRIMIESPLSSRSSFMVSARRSYLDQIIGRSHPVEDEEGRRDTLRTGYYFYDLSAKLTYRAGRRHRFTASYYGGKDDLDLRLPFDLSIDLDNWLRPADLFVEIGQFWTNNVVSLRHEMLVSPRFFLTNNAYFSGYLAREGALIRPTGTSLLRSDYDVHLYDYGFKSDLDYYPALSHQVRAGFHVVQRTFWSVLDADISRSVSAEDSLFQQSNSQAWELSTYLQDSWNPSPRWQAVPGLRWTYFSGGGYMGFDPRLSVHYVAIPNKLTIRAGVGSQVQYLHRLRDRHSYMYDLVSSRWVPTGRSVRPSSSHQVAIGLDHIASPRTRITADVFYRKSRNVLIPVDEYQNKDGLDGPGIELGTLLGQYTPALSRVFGLELSGYFESGPWSVWSTATAGRTLNRAPELGERRYRPNRFDAPVGFRTAAAWKGNRWTFSVSGEARSGYPYSVPVARYTVGDPLDGPDRYLHRPEINNGRLSPYWRIDTALGLRFRVMKANCTASLLVYNVSNRKNVVSRLYDPAESPVVAQDRYGLPLIPLFELEVAL